MYNYTRYTKIVQVSNFFAKQSDVLSFYHMILSFNNSPAEKITSICQLQVLIIWHIENCAI